MEVDALQNLEGFEVVATEEVKQNQVCCANFVDYVKSYGTKRSGLFVFANNDHLHGLFTATTTIKGKSCHPLLAI